MNSQLFTHLNTFDSDDEYSMGLNLEEEAPAGRSPSPVIAQFDTFDSDEEFSESPELHEEEHIGPVLHDMMNPIDMHLLKLKLSLRRFATPRSWKNGLMKIVWLLPIAIALGDFIGLAWSLSLGCLCLVILQLQPRPPQHLEEIEVPKLRKLKDLSKLTETVAGYVRERRDDILTPNKRQVVECRKEVSRLLGLVGAPSLDWGNLDIMTKEEVTVLADIQPQTTIAVVKFLEAHTQFLLTVDEALYWLQTSSSLHLGLGPRSQCVERVERATIAREYRSRRRQSIGASLIVDGVDENKLTPQRGNTCNSVLSLSFVRNHLAKAIVDEGDSFTQVWKSVRLAAGTAGSPGSFPRVDLLTMPQVVDLAWIRGARQQLAALVGHLIDHFCTLEVLATLSSETLPLQQLDKSMWNAKNAREYLLCNLLLGNKRNTRELRNPNDPLTLALLQYHEQLEALTGAIWSCQQYATNMEQADEEERKVWWGYVRELGETCRTVENEINASYFSKPVEAEGVDDKLDEDFTERMGNSANGGSETIEHKDDGFDRPAEVKGGDAPTKTMVFKGKGAKELNSESSSKPGKGSQASRGKEEVTLPPRDTISQHLMVKELQNRITVLRPPEDEEDEPETEAERQARLAQAPTTSLFLGASGSLLSELKLSMPSAETDGGEIVEE